MKDAVRGTLRAPLVILCSPRSFSSVVCSMLGQHPEMYGFPELNLFLTDTVAELFELDVGIGYVTGRKWPSYTPGLTRTIAELLFRSQAENALVQALAWLKAREHWMASDMFAHLLRLLEPRIGIDKSPRTCLSTQSLRCALAFHAEARFIHLTRHPLHTIPSIAAGASAMQPGSNSVFSAAEQFEFAAQLWCSCQQTILRETAALPRNRILLVHGEDLLNHPEDELPRVARWLGIRDDALSIALMLHPERSPYAHPGAWPSPGDQDPGFLANPRLRRAQAVSDPRVLEKWELEAECKSSILSLAKSLGYDR